MAETPWGCKCNLDMTKLPVEAHAANSRLKNGPMNAHIFWPVYELNSFLRMACLPGTGLSPPDMLSRHRSFHIKPIPINKLNFIVAVENSDIQSLTGVEIDSDLTMAPSGHSS